jgi:glycerol-3-phosphate acyltransferase PlsY
VAVILGSLIAGSMGASWCVLAVFCGHVWPVFYQFKGGKGVATAFGALMGLNPLLGLSTLGVVVILVLITKRMSVGSIAGAAAFPFLAIYFERDFVYIGIVLAIIVIVKHRANIKRLIKGEEPKMSIFEKRK